MLLSAQPIRIIISCDYLEGRIRIIFSPGSRRFNFRLLPFKFISK
jgi:hypothetical protein